MDKNPTTDEVFFAQNSATGGSLSSNNTFPSNNTTPPGNNFWPQTPSSTQAQNTISSGDATKSLIGKWLAWYIILSIIYTIVYSLISSAIESLIIQVIAAIILQALIVLAAWVMSTKFTFKDKLLKRSDVGAVMKNLIIFSIIVCAVNAAYRFVQVSSSFDSAIESNYELKVKEKMAEQVYDKQKMQEYYQQKSEAISEAKEQTYVYLAVFEVFSIAIFLAILPFEKKLIMKHATEEENAPNPFAPPSPVNPTTQ